MQFIPSHDFRRVGYDSKHGWHVEVSGKTSWWFILIGILVAKSTEYWMCWVSNGRRCFNLDICSVIQWDLLYSQHLWSNFSVRFLAIVRNHVCFSENKRFKIRSADSFNDVIWFPSKTWLLDYVLLTQSGLSLYCFQQVFDLRGRPKIT